MGRTLPTPRFVALICSNLLLPLSVLIFALGFFPYKPLLPGLAAYETSPYAELSSAVPDAAFDRLIFMVVDALRSDFVYGYNSGFEFTQGLIRNGSAIPFTAFAAPPTVTMPRIKALTTGSVPSFADLIFNLDESDTGSSLAGQDTWLAQIKAQDGRVVFYGDDTWLRLFPGNFFARAEGTSSFFVSDFTEVDNNVTRHLPGELARDDWNAMIVHYLGLDHIGHKTGPQGPNMIPKQREMDGIVQQIYESMLTEAHQERTLLVIAGDHGMNAGGNHGGSGPGETEPALVFVSPRFKTQSGSRASYECPTLPKEGTEFQYYKKIQQSDLVPTLASLLRFPIPKNSLGVLIPDAINVDHSQSGLTRMLYENAAQIRKIVEAKLGSDNFLSQVKRERDSRSHGEGHELGDEETIAMLWVAVEAELAALKQSANHHAANKALLEFLVVSQDFLSNVASLYDIPKMITGIVLAVIASVLAIFSLPRPFALSLSSIYTSLTCLLYGIMMFASSYVEEEQHFWYWLTPVWIVFLAVRAISQPIHRPSKSGNILAAAIILTVHRLVVRWNQTGQKHTGEPDIVHAFFPEHHVFMWLLILATYSYLGFQVMWTSLADLVSREIATSVAVVLLIPAIYFKLNFTQADAPELVQDLAQQIRDWSQEVDLVRQAQIFFVLLGLISLAVLFLSIFLAKSTAINSSAAPAIRITLPERLHFLLTLFLITQTRAPNIPLFLGFELQRHALRALLQHGQSKPGPEARITRDSHISPSAVALSTLLFSQTYFFSMGGSNSISSIDLSNAYNGVGDYNIFAVGILLFSANWTGPIWWCSAAVLMTFTKLQKDNDRAAEAPRERTWVEEERANLRTQANSSVSTSSVRSKTSSFPWSVYVTVMTIFVGTSLLAIMVTCTILRTHLFIWTVFSPKYLYAMAWCIGWHLLINIGVGSSLRLLGRIA